MLVLMFLLCNEMMGTNESINKSGLYTDPPVKINLPTEDYGIQQVENYIEGNKHYLKTSVDRIITTYDFTGKYSTYPWDLNLIPQFSVDDENDQWTDEAPKSVFQTHWIFEKLTKNYFAYFGINYQNVSIAANVLNFEAGTKTSSNLNSSRIYFGSEYYYSQPNMVNSTYGEFDVVAHELAHVYLYDRGLSVKELHEGVCDMFAVYMEHRYAQENDPNIEIDWKIANNIKPNWWKRDLSNPKYPCYNATVATLEDYHDRGQPLGHWFYLLTVGPGISETSCVSGLGIEKAIFIVKNSVDLLTDPQSGYSEFRDASLNFVVNTYGLFSPEASTLRWAWNKICVPTNTIINSTGALITLDNTNNSVFDNIQIADGAQVHFLGNYIMLPGSNIFCGSNTKITLLGSSFASCDEQKWKGITVTNTIGSGTNWFTAISNNTKIKNAEEGLSFIGERIFFSLSNISFEDNNIGIKCESLAGFPNFKIGGNIKFINNLQGIVYKNSPNKIEISSCEFSAPGIINDESNDKIPSGISFENSGGENTVNSCRFNDLTLGIEALDSKTSITNNNQFENCAAAITTLASGPANGSLTVNNTNYFLNCPKGIDFSGLDVSGVIIQDNLFENCSNSIFGQGSNSFNIIDNTFYGGAKNIEISASGNSMNTIDCNDINYPTEGGISIYEENLNTSFMGNSFQNTGIYDIHIDGSVKEKIGSDNQAPLNYFSTSHTNDITITNNTDAFKYYASPSPPANTDPDNSEPSDIPANWEEDTNTEYSGPVCEIPPGNEATNFGLWVDYYCQLLREYKLHPSITLERRIKLIESDLKRVLWNYFIIMFGGDNFTKDNWMRFWNQIILSYCNSYYPLKQLYYMSIKVGDCYKADSILTMIEQSMLLPPDGSRLDSLERLDKQSFIAINRIGLRYYCDQLRIDSTWVTRDSFMFNSRDIAILHQETNRLIPESAYARTLYFLATNELLIPTLGDMQFRSESKQKVITNEQDISLYPNPADDKIEIYFKNPIDGILSIYDILGNRMITNSLQGSIKYEIDVNDLKNGLYIITVSDDEGKMIKTEKLVISH